MTGDKRIKIKNCILKLIRLKSAGTPAELASRFGISERSIKRMIHELKQEGHRIVFWHAGNTYIIDPDCDHYVKIAVRPAKPHKQL